MYSVFMKVKKRKREIATKNVRIYPSTLIAAQRLAQQEHKTLAQVIHEKMTNDKNS